MQVITITQANGHWIARMPTGGALLASERLDVLTSHLADIGEAYRIIHTGAIEGAVVCSDCDRIVSDSWEPFMQHNTDGTLAHSVRCADCIEDVFRVWDSDLLS